MADETPLRHDEEAPAGLIADRVREAADVRIWEDPFQVLHVEADGTVHADVRPRRVFPLSGKAGHISFVAEKNKEVVLLRDPEGLDAPSRAALDKTLARTYYSARILRVDSVTETMGVSLWHVLTDRGHAVFEVVDRHRHIHVLTGGRFLITDADGSRFEIPCVDDLDERSQALVETET